MKRRFEMEKLRGNEDGLEEHDANETNNSLGKSAIVGIKSSWSILRERDFLCVVLGNFFRTMRLIANVNFMTIFTETLVSPSGTLPLESDDLSLFYQLNGSLPSVRCIHSISMNIIYALQIAFILMWPALFKFGPWTVNTIQGVLSCINCVVALFVGRSNPVWFAVFLTVEK